MDFKPLSISTCWNSHRHSDGYAMLEELRGMGFERVELSHGIRLALVPGIVDAVRDGVVQISSLHNFCPLPPGVFAAAPNLFRPSSPKREEMALWERYTRSTLQFARDLRAEAIVMHSGSVFFFLGSPEKKVDRFIEKYDGPFDELRDNADFVALRDRVMKKISRKSGRDEERSKAAMASLLDLLNDADLRLGIEIREALDELPLDAEIANFLEGLGGLPRYGYWHDIGHAHFKHCLGLIDHEDHLAQMRRWLLGFHIHDLSDKGRDHQEPGTGLVDFPAIARFFEPFHTLVLELSPRLSSDAVLRSKDYIENLLVGKASNSRGG